MPRPFIERISSLMPPYGEYKRRLDCDSFTAHRTRRQGVLIAAAKEAKTFDELREVVLEHLDPEVLKVPRG